MNKSVLRRIGPAIFACIVAAWAVGFAWSWLGFSNERFLPAMRAGYAARQALVLLLDWYVPVQAVAIMAALSLASRGRGTEQPLPFPRLASSAVITLVVLAAALFVVQETAGLGSRRRLADMEARSRLARQYAEMGAAAEQAGRWAEAADDYVGYLAIDPGNDAMTLKKLDAQTRAAREEASGARSAPTPAAVTGVDAPSLLARAERFYDAEDWYSAHFYASQAAAIDPRRADAARLAALALEKIQALEPTAADQAGRSRYIAKRGAYEAFVRGEHLAAWYAFSQLAAANPDDADIAQFKAKSGAELAGEVFFLDEAAATGRLPGAEHLLFINAATSDAVEAVWIGRLVTGTSTFGFDVEAIRWRRDGSVAWHLAAPYAKLLEEPGAPARLLLHAADRTDQRIQYLPTYYDGSQSRDPAEREMLSLGPSAEELPLLSMDRAGLADIGMTELWTLEQRLGAFGRLSEQVSVEIAMRAVEPLVLLAVSLAALAFGWSLRGRWAGRAPFAAWLAMPFAALAIAVASELIMHAHRVAVAFIVLSAGMPVALVALGVIEVALVAASLAALAGQTS